MFLCCYEHLFDLTHILQDFTKPIEGQQKKPLDQHWRNARVHTLHDPVRWKIHAIGNYYLNGTLPARHAWI